MPAKKKTDAGTCTFCNKPVDTKLNDNFFSKTKRGTVIFFHGNCYRIYHRLCGDWVDMED